MIVATLRGSKCGVAASHVKREALEARREVAVKYSEVDLSLMYALGLVASTL